MKLIKLLPLVCLLLAGPLVAQKKAITLDEIWDQSFKPESMDVLHSMKNGQQYSVLNLDEDKGVSSIDIYDYKTLQKIRTIVQSEDFQEFEYFTDYTFSDDETKVILATEVEKMYRHSKRAKYYVYDSVDHSVQAISEEMIQEPTFAPDGQKIAYGFNNDIYVRDLLTERTKRLTSDGLKDEIINGITDWVYEEEFAFVKAFEWNAKSDRIAYLKFDETFVPEFSMDIYGTELYQTQQNFKYPKAGELNSEVTLHIYDLLKSESKKVYLTQDYTDYYIPRIKWTNDPDILSAQYLNRHQNKLDLWLINANGYESSIALSEEDKAYVDVTFDLTFLSDNSFIWTSEKSGNNHIYHYSKDGQLLNQLTNGNWEVTKYYGFDQAKRKAFYQSTENGSTNRGVYSIGIDGKNKKGLADKAGTNKASFSTNYSYFINEYSSVKTPNQYTLNNAANGNVEKTIVNNQALADKLSGYQMPEKEFSTITVNGNELNMYLIKPSDFDASKTYPLFMYQYSGPGSQRVSNKWNRDRDYWHQMLAEQGVIIACVDGRGTGFKGAAFKKMTQNQLGKYEVEDQIEAAKQLGNRSYIDSDNMGIWGWSYGGFMSSNAILKGNDVFKMAIAVAPVSSWRFYDSIYTERYMTTPEENPDGYDDNSPINHVDKLKGEYLIIHGTGDDNVHLQNTMRMVDALVQADKDFDWMIYPDKAHSLKGGNTLKHLYNKMTKFVHQTIGDPTKSVNTNKVSQSAVIKSENRRPDQQAATIDKSDDAGETIEAPTNDAEGVEIIKTIPKTAEEIKAANKAYLAKQPEENVLETIEVKEKVDKKAQKKAERLKRKQEKEAKKKKEDTKS